MKPDERERMIAKLATRDGGRCWLCGGKFNWRQRAFAKLDDNAITFDHVIPKSQGGAKTFENLRLAHRGCNNKRGNVEGEHWMYKKGGATWTKPKRRRAG